MLTNTRIMLEQAINRLHEAENNELEEENKIKIRMIIYSIRHILEGQK
jgi:hypothetical protein